MNQVEKTYVTSMPDHIGAFLKASRCFSQLGINITRISTHKITDNTDIILIEPPCGSNTIIIKSNDDVLFVDSGYACYSDEMTCVGSILIIMIGTNLMGITKIKVADFLPAIIYAPVIYNIVSLIAK